jgi:uncharacterized protein YjiS (DUF1127 family)
MGLHQTLRKWSAYWQTVRELTWLESRQLTDLGIARGDIRRIARDRARGSGGSRVAVALPDTVAIGGPAPMLPPAPDGSLAAPREDRCGTRIPTPVKG